MFLLVRSTPPTTKKNIFFYNSPTEEPAWIFFTGWVSYLTLAAEGQLRGSAPWWFGGKCLGGFFFGGSLDGKNMFFRPKNEHN